MSALKVSLISLLVGFTLDGINVRPLFSKLVCAAVSVKDLDKLTTVLNPVTPGVFMGTFCLNVQPSGQTCVGQSVRSSGQDHPLCQRVSWKAAVYCLGGTQYDY